MVIFTVDPETSEQVRLGPAVNVSAAACASIAPPDPPIPQSEKSKSDRMVILVGDLFGWDSDSGEVIEPAGLSHR